MEDLSDFLVKDPYSMGSKEYQNLVLPRYQRLTQHHIARCSEYRSILSAINFSHGEIGSLVDVPFLPVRLFKTHQLLSVDKNEVFKTMTSSGTSGQQVSKIYLDRSTASAQTRVLTGLVSTVIGRKRLPLLVIDSSDVVKNRQMFSARGAGILGFSMFGAEVHYALDEKMNLDIEKVEKFLDRHAGREIFVFGFTSIIWEHFVIPLRSAHKSLRMSNAVVIHGGGWKKLLDQAVDNGSFKAALRSVASIEKVVSYYGMVEQTGSIYLECDHGFLHTSIYSDVVVRRPRDFSECEIGEPGLLEVLSVIPTSYPGHALLTEDIGILHGRDDCGCGRRGGYFQVVGRAPRSEPRGCSDTYAKPT